MKYSKLYRLLILSLITSACAKQPSLNTPKPCAGLTSIGAWHSNVANDTLTLTDACKGTGTYCNETFTFSRPNSANQITVRTLTTNGNAGCLNVSDHVCTVDATSSTLNIDCGLGVVNYLKQ